MFSHLSPKRGTAEIGRFGLGFKSVLGVTNAPEFFSRSGSFRFDRAKAASLIRPPRRTSDVTLSCAYRKRIAFAETGGAARYTRHQGQNRPGRPRSPVHAHDTTDAAQRQWGQANLAAVRQRALANWLRVWVYPLSVVRNSLLSRCAITCSRASNISTKCSSLKSTSGM